MSYSFCPMLVVVKGETVDSGFLPKGNYVEINGKKNPIAHCFNLEMPLGSCEVVIHSPPPNTIHRASSFVKANQCYRITLQVDASRNIIDAAFEVEDNVSDPYGLHKIMCDQVIENRTKVEAWRREQCSSYTPSSNSGSSYSGSSYSGSSYSGSSSSGSTSSSGSKGGKQIGWGIAMIVLFALAFFSRYVVNAVDISTDTTSLAFVVVGFVVGLVLLVVGLYKKKNQ